MAKFSICKAILFAFVSSAAGASHAITKYCVNESSVVYDYENEPSIIGTFVKCLRTVQDAMIAPYYDTGVRINVSTEVFLNNLISIDEVSSTVTLDFFFNTIWDDHRFLMPALWNAMENPEAYEVGVDISEAATITNVQGVQPLVWVPDIVFPDAISSTRSAQYLKLYPNGQIRQMEHFVMTFSQSHMNYQDYPCDVQNITMRFFSFTLTSNQLVFTPFTGTTDLLTPPVDFIYPIGSSSPSFAQNPEWSLVGTDYGYADWQLSPGFFSRPFGIVTFKVKRQSSGILQRLCLPILLIMILCALSYWGNAADRVSTTVTGLLAIAAVYIAVIGAIPLVGYLTRLDEYMFMMFIIIFVNTILHMAVIRLNVAEKGKNWPLRKLAVRIIEFFGRLTMIPWIILSYIIAFWPVIRIPVASVLIILLGAFDYVMFVRYFPELKSTFYVTKMQLEAKKAAGKRGQGLSVLEMRFLQLYAVGGNSTTGGNDVRKSNDFTSYNGDVEIEMKETSTNPINT